VYWAIYRININNNRIFFILALLFFFFLWNNGCIGQSIALTSTITEYSTCACCKGCPDSANSNDGSNGAVDVRAVPSFMVANEETWIVTKIQWSTLAAAGGGAYQVIIYNDTSDSPGTNMAIKVSITVTTANQTNINNADIYDFPFSPSLTLTAGKYWLQVLLLNTNSNNMPACTTTTSETALWCGNNIGGSQTCQQVMSGCNIDTFNYNSNENAWHVINSYLIPYAVYGEKIGACCLANNTCETSTQSACNGTYKGDEPAEVCSLSLCEPVDTGTDTSTGTGTGTGTGTATGTKTGTGTETGTGGTSNNGGGTNTVTATGTATGTGPKKSPANRVQNWLNQFV